MSLPDELRRNEINLQALLDPMVPYDPPPPPTAPRHQKIMPHGCRILLGSILIPRPPPNLRADKVV